MSAIVYAVVFVLVLVYGFATGYDYSGCPVRKAALIQQNIDPWQGGMPLTGRHCAALQR